MVAPALAALGLALVVPTAVLSLPPAPLDPLGGSQHRPQFAARADGSLWAVAEDAAGPGLVLFRSADGGASWTRARELTDTAELSRPALAIGEGEAARLLIAYERDADGAAPAIGLFLLDLDLGSSRTEILPAAPGESVGRPRLCVDSPEFHHWYGYLVYLARDQAGGARVELRRSLDLGIGWTAPRALLAASASAAPDVDFGQQTLHVAVEHGEFQRDVRAIRSLDFGLGWTEPALLAATAADESGPRLAAANGAGVVAVAFTRELAAGGTLVEARISQDEGATWTELILSGLSPAARLPALGVSRVRGLLQAAWLDGAAVMHAYASVDRPLRWSPPFPVRAGGAGAVPEEAPPAVAANPARTAETAVVWVERESGGPPRALFDHGSWPAALVRADGGGDYPTIQAALDDAWTGSEISLAPGLYTGPGNVDLEFGGREATLRGLEPDPALCVIDCRGDERDPHRAFRFRAGEGRGSIVRNLTITGGHAAAAGPGGGDGGGVLLEAGASPTFEGVVFQRNVAEGAGGGVHASGAGAPPGASDGPAFSLCRFEGNVAVTGGGGLHCEADLAPLVGWTIFYANRSEQGAGGLDCRARVAVTVSGCTFVLDGGEPAAGLGLRDGASAAIDHTIFAFGRRGAGVVCAAGSSATAEWTDIYGNAGGDWGGCLAGQLEDPLRWNLQADPLFCELSLGRLSLRSGSPCDERQQIGVFGTGCPTLPTAVEPGPPSGRPELSGAPNPFNPRTELRFRLPEPGRTRLTVHDLAGRQVALLADGPLAAGEHRATWDGRDERGRPLPSGAYVCRLEAPGGTRTLRLLLLR